MNQHQFNLTHYCLTTSTQKYPTKDALVIVHALGKDEHYTFQQLYHDVACLAQGLRTLKITPGSPFILRSPKNYQFVLLFFAAISAGLVPVTTLTALTEDELNYIIQDAKAALFFQDDSVALPITTPSYCRTLFNQDILQLRKTPYQPLEVTTAANDPAFLIYTSGSTSRPKGVLHAHRVVLGREPIRQYWLNVQAGDKLLHTGKPCWTYTMGAGFIDPWVVGATSYFYTGEPTADIWFRLIEHYGITLLASSPSFYKQMLAVEHPERFNLKSLRQATSAGEALPPQIIEFWRDHFHVPIYEALGMSEMSTFISSGHTVPIRLGSPGKIQPGRRVAILPAHGTEEPVKTNEQGILAVHRDNLGFMLGYLNREEDERKACRGDWFLTGDLVSQDEDGYIWHHGRWDDVLNIAGGHRVSPVEIEEVLIQHKAVAEAACGITKEGLSDNLLTAYIVLNDNQKPTDSLEQDLLAFARKHLSSNKIPAKIIWVKALPRNANGKVVRRLLGH